MTRRSMAMNAFQRVQVIADASAARSMPDPPHIPAIPLAFASWRYHRDTIAIGDFRHRRIADNGKRQRLQRVSREELRWLRQI